MYIERAMIARTIAAQLLTSADSALDYNAQAREYFREYAEVLFATADLYEFHPELCQ